MNQERTAVPERSHGIPAASSEARPSRRAGRIALDAAAVLLATAHFIFLMSYFEPAIHQPDANGYFAQATRIAREGRTWLEPESPLQYVGMHWLVTPEGRYFSRYPPGFPAVLAIPFSIDGARACLVTNVLMASLCLLGLYLVCSVWVGRGWGLLAAAMLACNPVANNWALGYFAHTATAFFLVWGVYFLARWERSPTWGWAAAAGFFLGMLPSVRYPAALFCAAAALFVLLTLASRRKAWRSALVGGLAMAVPVGALLLRNQLAFGAFWRTGYALTNEQTGFAWDYFTRSAVPYIQNLQGEGAGLLFALGVVGIVLMCARRETWRHGVLLATLVAPVTLLYMAYYWAPGARAAGTMRFLVPTFFIYGVAAVWLLKMLARHYRRATVVASLVLIALTSLWGLSESVTSLRRLEPASAALATVTQSIREHIEPGSLVIAGNSIQQHLDFVGDWKLVDESVLFSGGGLRWLRRRRTTDDGRPRPMQPEKLAAQGRRYEGLSGIDRTRQVVTDLWEWAGKTRKVYWVGEQTRIDEFEATLGQTWPDKFVEVASIQLPERDLRDDRRRRFGGFAPPDGGPQGEGPPGEGPQGEDSARDNRARRILQRLRPGAARRMGGGLGRLGALTTGGNLVIVEWTAGE